MKNYSVRKYEVTDFELWNTFISNAKNATFLFHRDFMEYHKDRFDDFSLLIFENEKLISVLPANKVENKLYSHQGLTYGGFVYNEKLSVAQIEVAFITVLHFIRHEQFQFFEVKLIPIIYHQIASNEIDYFLFANNGKIIKRDMDLAIDYAKPLSISKSKLKHFRRISNLGISVKEEIYCDAFWNNVLMPKLKDKFDTSPIHTVAEVNYLKSKFPENIKQFNAYYEGEIVAGITLFCSKQVVKSQYGATTSLGEKIRALDFLFISLIQFYSEQNVAFFDMGTVNGNYDNTLNYGLLNQKEELGCKTYIQDCYLLNLNEN